MGSSVFPARKDRSIWNNKINAWNLNRSNPFDMSFIKFKSINLSIISEGILVSFLSRLR